MKRPRMPKPLSVLNGDDLVTSKVQSVADSYERIEVLGTRIIDGSINVPMTNSEGPDNNIAMAVELDHMYLSCSDSKASLSKDIEIQQLKELLLVHLDLIHQQAEELVAKDKKIKSLKDENENLRLRLERMDRRVSLTTSKKAPADVPSSPSNKATDIKEDLELSPTPASNCVSPKACKVEDADSPVTRNHRVTETPKKTPPKTTTPPALKVTSPSPRERRPRNKDAGKDASHSENESDHDVATATSTAVTTTTTTTTAASTKSAPASPRTTPASPRSAAASPRSAAASPRSAAGSPRSTAASPRTTPTPSSPARATTEDKLVPKKEEERTRNRSGQKRRHQVQQEMTATSEETDTASATTPNKRTRDRRERLSPGDSHSTQKTPSTDQHNLRPRERTKEDAGTPKRESSGNSSDLRPSTPTIRTAALETKRLRQRLLLKDQAGRRRETRGQPQDTKVVRGEGVLTTTQTYFLPTPNIPCEDLSGGEEPTQNVVEIPRWRKRLLTSLYVMEGTENLDDEIFNKRHAKHEQDEKRRKRWDLQRLREQRRYERLRERYEGRQGGGDSQEPCDLSLWPMPDSARYLHVDDSVPVCAFGHALATYTPSEFWLPWLAEGNSTNPGMSTRRRKR